MGRFETPINTDDVPVEVRLNALGGRAQESDLNFPASQGERVRGEIARLIAMGRLVVRNNIVVLVDREGREADGIYGD